MGRKRTEQYHIRFDWAEFRAIQKAARELGHTVAHIIRTAVADWLSRKGKGTGQ